MYVAEIQGKFSPAEERKEDILTSNVFSFFKYAKREIFLRELLQHLNLPVQKKEVDEAEFIFWPSFEDGTEPDLVIIVGKYYLLFEAKLYSGFGEGPEFEKYQILREIKGGKLEADNFDKEFIFIVITAHYARHQLIAKNPYIKNVEYIWINWHQIALLIFNVLSRSESLDTETMSFAEDLYTLLLRMNLRKFAGISVLTPLGNLQPSSANLFFDPTTSEHRGDFIGFRRTMSKLPMLFHATDLIFFQTTPSFFGFVEKEDSLNKFDTIFYKG